MTNSKHRWYAPPDDRDPDGIGEALGNARRILTAFETVETDGVRGDLLGALAAKVTGETAAATGTTPTRTRFSDPSRTLKSINKLEGAFTAALARFDVADLCTLPTHPARYDSALAATATFMDDVDLLKRWLRRRFGSVPPNVVVPEFTDRAAIHAHVVAFGETVPESALSDYWHGRGRGYVVDTIRLEDDDGAWTWADDTDAPTDVAGRTPREYLGKTAWAAYDLADADQETVHAAANALRAAGRGKDPDPDALARGREWWPLACYWAGGPDPDPDATRREGIPFVTASPALKVDGDPC